MSKLLSVVLVGAGQASVSAARTLRDTGFDGEIAVIGDEPHAPYQRPPLSKEYLQGGSGRDDVWLAQPGWYADNHVRLELGRRAVRVNKQSLDVELDDGRLLKADAVLVATGGTPRKFPGVAGESILYLRTLDDADRIREKVRAGRRIAVVGAGFIGSEVAASARALGAEVILVEAMKAPLERVLGEAMGKVCGSLHEENGVDLRCGVSIETIAPSGAGALIKTRNGQSIEADAVIVGIGIAPNAELATASDITVGNGIRVDEFCRTDAPGVYAAGDVANHHHPLFGRRIRVEHFDNATRQGAAAALNMLGMRTSYEDPHWFWSDQYTHNLQYVGDAQRWDELVIRGSIEERNFIAFYLHKGKIAAAFGLNRGADIMAAKSLLSARIAVAPAVLQDESVDLESLAGEETEVGTTGRDGTPVKEHGEFVRVARSGQVGEGTVRRFIVADTELAIARVKGNVYALHNLCTHLACPLSSGKIKNDALHCLCHGSVFNPATGEPINPPATRPVKTYPVREVDGQIYVAIR